MKEKKKILNYDIKSSTVQLIIEDWDNLWEMPLSEARKKAEELWLDLMEIWKKWDVSIVKMLDYWKYLYKLKKQEQKNKVSTKAPDLKTVRITFKIWEHDLEIKKKQSEHFADGWHPLKVTLMLKWRENQYSKLAFEKISSFVDSIAEIYKLDWDVKKNWNTFIAMLKPKK
jgi:translation initiation factor IF-3